LVRSAQPVDRSFAEQVIPNPLELDRISMALCGRKVRRNPFELELAGQGVDSLGIKVLAAQPALADFRGLTFTFSVLSSEDVAVLAALPHRFEHFELHLGKIGREGATALATASWLRTLKCLTLPNQNIGDAGMAGVIQRLDGGPIECLSLRHNDLGPKTADALASASLPSLKVLELSYNALDDVGIASIVANPRLSRLEVLELLGTGASRISTQAIAAARHLTSLRILNLGDQVGDEAAASLIEARLPSLQRLQLRGVCEAATAALKRRAGGHVTNALFA
jgi:hypothetical protein